MFIHIPKSRVRDGAKCKLIMTALGEWLQMQVTSVVAGASSDMRNRNTIYGIVQGQGGSFEQRRSTIPELSNENKVIQQPEYNSEERPFQTRTTNRMMSTGERPRGRGATVSGDRPKQERASRRARTRVAVYRAPKFRRRSKRPARALDARCWRRTWGADT